MSNTTAQAPPDLPILLGPILIGSAIDWLLWGILAVQVYYYSLFFRDPWHQRLTVYGLFIVETGQSIAGIQCAYFILVSGWGNPARLTSPGKAFSILPIWVGIISFIVQWNFAWRIYKFGNSQLSRIQKYAIQVVVVLICCASIVQSLNALICGAKFVTVDDVTKIHDLSIETAIWLGGSCFCDVTITIAMVYLLSRAKKESMVGRTQAILNKLIQQVVETGFLTAATASAQLIFFIRLNHSYTYGGVALMLTKLYTNTLVALFNARARERNNLFSGDTSGRSTHSHSHSNNVYPMVPTNIRSRKNDQMVIQVETVQRMIEDHQSEASIVDSKALENHSFTTC